MSEYKYLNLCCKERGHTELVAFFVVAMQEYSTGLKHPPGNYTLSEI